MTKRDRYAQQLGQEPELGQMPTQADIFYPSPAPIPPRRSAGGLALKDGEVQIGAFTLTGTGLQINGNASEDEWRKVGDLLFKLEGAIQWLIGDWLAYGEDVKYGDIGNIAAALGRETKTLYDYAYVARNVVFSVRTENLSWAHHSRVTKFPQDKQDYALKFAEKHGYSFLQFRKWIKLGMPETGLLSEEQAPALPSHGSTPVPKSALNGLEKLTQRDLSTLKPKQIAEGLAYITQARQWLDEMERRLRGDHNA